MGFVFLNHHSTPADRIRRVINTGTIMATTIKFQREGQPARYMGGMSNYKGYVVQEQRIGVGPGREVGGMFDGEGDTWTEYDQHRTVYKPFFDGAKIPASERDRIDGKYKCVTEAIADGKEDLLIKWAGGEGYTCTDADEEKRQQAKEAAAKRQETAKASGEVICLNADEVYSSVNRKYLHALGITYSPSKNYIGVYTTHDCKGIGGKSTYDLRDKFAAAGMAFHKDSKQWRMPYTEENLEKVIALVREHDTLSTPEDSGMYRCWECGCYFKPKRGDWDGGMPYCGC